jgi:hypothetical protein
MEGRASADMSGPAGIVTLDLFTSKREPGQQSAFLILLAFLVSFLAIRTSARLIRSPRVPWWPGNVEAGGVHIHHLVWGISLLLVAGFTAFASDLDAPWWQITAIGFGIGAGLTLDEFALWLYLKDVYWEQEGRDSIDAVVVATLLAGLVVLGVQPFALDETSSVVGTAATVAVVLTLAGITFMKGRILLGALALFVPVVGVVAALRVAKPTSPWARWVYRGRRAGRMARAQQRFAGHRRMEVLGRRLRNVIGGAPSDDELSSESRSAPREGSGRP